MTKVKKVISKIGEVPISITSDGIKYFLNGGIAYRTDRHSELSVDFVEIEEDEKFMYLNFCETFIESNTEDTIVIDKKIDMQLKYSKQDRLLSVSGEGFTSGIDKFIRQLDRLSSKSAYSEQNLRKFVFSMLKNEPFYDDFIENFVIDNFDNFYASIIRLYLTDNICLLSFFSKFNLFESVCKLLSYKDQEKILYKIKESQEAILYKFCDLFNRYKIDCLEEIFYAGNNLDNNEMELLYKFIETILKLFKIMKKSSVSIYSPSIKDVIISVVDIKLTETNLTLALNTICKDIFKNYNMVDIGKVITCYRDYLMMLKDIDDDKTTKFPKSIIVEHDKLVERYNLIQAERESNRKIEQAINKQRFDKEKLIEAQRNLTLFKKAITDYKYLTYENNEFKIITPEVPNDLTNEGISLDHCVGRYVSSVIRQSSKILFCRKKEDVNIPYMTIEIKDNRLVQAKKYKDSYPDEKDEVFLSEFCYKKNLVISGY